MKTRYLRDMAAMNYGFAETENRVRNLKFRESDPDSQTLRDAARRRSHSRKVARYVKNSTR